MVDHANAFSVEVPVGWTVADENLTPWLSSPTEILSSGTFEMPVSHDPGGALRVSDAPVAPATLAAMTSTDAFVSVQASGPTEHADDRPSSFQSAAKPLCCSARTGDYPFTWWWVPFIDQGRGYYLFVAVGNDASPSTSDQAWALANSLAFGAAGTTTGVDRMGVYEAMIRDLANAPDAVGSQSIHVLADLCSGLVAEKPCLDRLTPAEQQELTDRLLDVGPVTFLNDDDSLSVPGGVIVLGPLVDTRDGLRVSAGSGVCGGLCGSGATYVVVPTDSGYRVAGTDPSYGYWNA
jgi:hypothetical protein